MYLNDELSSLSKPLRDTWEALSFAVQVFEGNLAVLEIELNRISEIFHECPSNS